MLDSTNCGTWVSCSGSQMHWYEALRQFHLAANKAVEIAKTVFQGFKLKTAV